MKVELERLPDWPARLAAFVNQRRGQPYRYGVNDCWCFARGAVAAMTGVTLLAGVAAPTSWLGAAKAMIARGWETVEDVVTGVLGEPIAPALSRPGDIVSFELGGEYHLAVRVGDSAVSPGLRELVAVDGTEWRRAWMVG